MSRSSPAVLRVVSILSFFADHPGQAFTLTDLIRALKLSRATSHAILSALTETGYLYRNTDKSYVLGPALLNLGEVAANHFSPLQIVQPEIRQLADEFDAVCSVAFRERTEVVVRERATSASHLGYSTPRGARLPLLPQFAAPFFAGAAVSEVRGWMESVEPPPSKRQIDALFQGIDFVGKRGYQFNVRTKGDTADSEPHSWLSGRDSMDKAVVAEFQLKAKLKYDLIFIAAPVYDARRRVAFVIALQGLSGLRTGAQVQKIGERVVATCERITSFLSRTSASRQ